MKNIIVYDKPVQSSSKEKKIKPVTVYMILHMGVLPYTEFYLNEDKAKKFQSIGLSTVYNIETYEGSNIYYEAIK